VSVRRRVMETSREKAGLMSLQSLALIYPRECPQIRNSGCRLQTQLQLAAVLPRSCWVAGCRLQTQLQLAAVLPRPYWVAGCHSAADSVLPAWRSWWRGYSPHQAPDPWKQSRSRAGRTC
jgi:hypothetical protein